MLSHRVFGATVRGSDEKLAGRGATPEGTTFVLFVAAESPSFVTNR
jgi:hypothetical protein